MAEVSAAAVAGSGRALVAAFGSLGIVPPSNVAPIAAHPLRLERSG